MADPSRVPEPHIRCLTRNHSVSYREGWTRSNLICHGLIDRRFVRYSERFIARQLDAARMLWANEPVLPEPKQPVQVVEGRTSPDPWEQRPEGAPDWFEPEKPKKDMPNEKLQSLLTAPSPSFSVKQELDVDEEETPIDQFTISRYIDGEWQPIKDRDEQRFHVKRYMLTKEVIADSF